MPLCGMPSKLRGLSGPARVIRMAHALNELWSKPWSKPEPGIEVDEDHAATRHLSHHHTSSARQRERHNSLRGQVCLQVASTFQHAVSITLLHSDLLLTRIVFTTAYFVR